MDEIATLIIDQWERPTWRRSSQFWHDLWETTRMKESTRSSRLHKYGKVLQRYWKMMIDINLGRSYKHRGLTNTLRGVNNGHRGSLVRWRRATLTTLWNKQSWEPETVFSDRDGSERSIGSRCEGGETLADTGHSKAIWASKLSKKTWTVWITLLKMHTLCFKVSSKPWILMAVAQWNRQAYVRYKAEERRAGHT